MSNSIELTRIIEVLKEHGEQLTAQRFVIKSLLAIQTPAQLKFLKELINNSLDFKEHDHKKENDDVMLEHLKGVRREMPHVFPGVFDREE
ncbi:hypothetical protein CI665_014245 [Klebsiella quasipneumoniae subsp. similipneumoniae]|uniref:hypothetical protein n=1 Tax=Klebsiella/Raoultella group TaxID=2890311 RepID=UPI0007CCF4B9|nr:MULTISPECIES: hypothetical protein [Klebsiella/Raoultella group]AVJ60465.1 hypothetical protein CLQ71_16795 [Klebsiella variicola]MCZ7737945.1 hypothetical protein [Klebsiella pneumoniae]MEB6435657.1 hypothetical protein [Raoultella ornithinolytica]PKJ64852.1 hypothetical protein CW266_11410 [Klebsiella sp. T11]PXL45079.1 hypothetical protein DMS60_03470 [Klebsiella variicola]